MKYAFFPGCVSRGACPELMQSLTAVAAHIGMELELMETASCTGAGVISERNQKLADALNARNFALAEQTGLPLMNICSTCQGVMSSVNERLKARPEYLAEINEMLAEEDLAYSGNADPRNFMWVLVEDFGLDNLRSLVKRPLAELNVAPFYGCYISRPTDILGYHDFPERGRYLEMIIEACGATPVDYSGKKKCCGFPIITMNRKNSLTMAGNHVGEAQGKGADFMVTPCPLCHLNLDAQQPDAARVVQTPLNLPILHLSQLIGMALGIDEAALGLNRHVVSTNPVRERLHALPLA